MTDYKARSHSLIEIIKNSDSDSESICRYNFKLLMFVGKIGLNSICAFNHL